MSTAETHPSGFEVIVDDTGGISAEALAQYGLNRPGMHLRLLPEITGEMPKPRKSIIGALKGRIDVDAFENALTQGKAERIAQVMGEDDDQ